MEEKHSKQPLLYLFVALTASVGLAVTIAYLEIRRDAEVEQLRSEVAMLIKYVDTLKAKLNRTESFTKKFDEVMKRLSKSPPTAAGGTYDEEDEYYDDAYDDSYDYEDVKAPAANSTSREKRSVDEHGGRIHNVLHMRTLPVNKHAQENPPVLAKIFIVGDEQGEQTRRPNFVRLQTKEEEIHHGNGHHGHHHRSKSLEDGCDPVLAHFGADSGGSASIGLPHYEANHRMYHPEGVFRNWTPAAWVPHRDGQIVLDEENIIVKEPGIYFFYAQIFYANSHDRSGFRVFVNHRPVFQCTTTTRNCHGSNHMKWNSCFTGGLIKLAKDDNITLREIEGDRYTVFEKTKSFFGLFRVAVKP